MKLSFQNFDVFSAVSMELGQDIFYVMSSVNTQNMNAFLACMPKNLGERRAMVVMDSMGRKI